MKIKIKIKTEVKKDDISTYAFLTPHSHCTYTLPLTHTTLTLYLPSSSFYTLGVEVATCIDSDSRGGRAEIFHVVDDPTNPEFWDPLGGFVDPSSLPLVSVIEVSILYWYLHLNVQALSFTMTLSRCL